MTFQTFIFYFFSTVLVVAALGVITARNPVHAALLLVLAFFTSAGLWLQLQAEFLAIALVLVYVGAVMVLFLFVVMMLDINLASCAKDSGVICRWAAWWRWCWWRKWHDSGQPFGRFWRCADAAGRCRRVTAIPRNWAADLHRVCVSV